MARPGITYDAVHDAASALLAEGQTPTVQRVRERLGRGSHSTIAAHLRHFHEHQAHQQHDDNLPPPPPTSWQSACEQLWREAMQLASESFAAERQALDEREARSRGDREELLRRHQWLRVSLGQRETEVADLQGRHRALAADLAAEQQARGDLEQALAETRQLLEAERKHRAASEAAYHQQERLLREAAQARQAALEQQLLEERERGEAEQQAQLLAVDRLRVALDRERLRTEAAHNQARDQERELREQLQAVQREGAVWEARHTGLEQRLAGVETERERLAGALDNARRMITQLRLRLARRSGRTASPGGDGLQGGATGGVDGH